MALREKQIQQNYRPIIGVHKWFARRPGTLFRGLLLSEFVDAPLRECFFRANDLGGLRVADPFMGGGTPLLEANRLGCDIVGYDINPMAYWIVRQEIQHLDVGAYRSAASNLMRQLGQEIDQYYVTRCHECGTEAVPVKYFLWVKTIQCDVCGHSVDLFPGYLLAENQRHPLNVLVCSACGTLNEVQDRANPGPCRECRSVLSQKGPASAGTCKCPHCGTMNRYPKPQSGAPKHRMFALEYRCPSCHIGRKGRFFKKPDVEDLEAFGAAEARWLAIEAHHVPPDSIPPGDETDRLLRWGYRRYSEMFNERQLLGLEFSCRLISQYDDARLRSALATNLSDLLRYQNMLCRYDTMALKSLDIFSVHGFPVGLVQCESNLLGRTDSATGALIGSGGWANIVEKYARAKVYCQHPFEIDHRSGRKTVVQIEGEWIGDQRDGLGPPMDRSVELRCGSSTSANLPADSLDAVLTDPPYFANVQYAELMDFCYVWLRRLATVDGTCFDSASTRRQDELTGNSTLNRNLIDFAVGLSESYCRMAYALRPGYPFAFTYHHNDMQAYLPVAAALLDAGLVCSATLPCPAEMGQSIHINGTGSSIVDTVFICRSTGRVSRHIIASTPAEIARLVIEDARQLKEGGVDASPADVRCIAYGHLVRMAVWNLRTQWERGATPQKKLEAVEAEIRVLGGWAGVQSALAAGLSRTDLLGKATLHDGRTSYAYVGESDETAF